MPGTIEEYLTVRDVARLCRIHEVTVRRHILSGRLPSVRVGKSVRVRRQDLASYLEPFRADDESGRESCDEAPPFSLDDPFWSVVGAFEDPSGSWVSEEVHRAVAGPVPERL